jgi:Ca2+-binding EF-hand superfamily protein
MGCSSSVYPASLLSPSILHDLYLIELSFTDIQDLLKCFRHLDVDGNGYVELTEIYASYSMNDNLYMEHIFEQVSRQLTEQITIR